MHDESARESPVVATMTAAGIYIRVPIIRGLLIIYKVCVGLIPLGLMHRGIQLVEQLLI